MTHIANITRYIALSCSTVAASLCYLNYTSCYIYIYYKGFCVLLFPKGRSSIEMGGVGGCVIKYIKKSCDAHGTP